MVEFFPLGQDQKPLAPHNTASAESLVEVLNNPDVLTKQVKELIDFYKKLKKDPNIIIKGDKINDDLVHQIMYYIQNVQRLVNDGDEAIYNAFELILPECGLTTKEINGIIDYIYQVLFDVLSQDMTMMFRMDLLFAPTHNPFEWAVKHISPYDYIMVLEHIAAMNNVDMTKLFRKSQEQFLQKLKQVKEFASWDFDINANRLDTIFQYFTWEEDYSKYKKVVCLYSLVLSISDLLKDYRYGTQGIMHWNNWLRYVFEKFEQEADELWLRITRLFDKAKKAFDLQIPQDMTWDEFKQRMLNEWLNPNPDRSFAEAIAK